jgi:ribosomal protein S1
MATKQENPVYGNEELEDVFNEPKEGELPKGYTQEMYDMITNVFDVSVGKVLEGTLAGENDTEIMFDIGAKDYVRVEKNRTELPFFEGKKIGDTMEMLIVNKTDVPYLINGSVAAIYEARAHESLSEIDFEDPVTVYVRELTPAGYNLDLMHDGVRLTAFMPHTLAGINKLHDAAREAMVGQHIQVMIESFSREKGTYIVSRRKYLKTLVPKAMKKLKYNQTYEGHVTGTTPFGVFVEFNECLTGMIHKSNINPEYADKIKEIKPGTEIVFYIKEIIKNKIILTQVIKESLWDEIKVGQKIEGEVKAIKPFGTLVKLDDETIGLIHTSELTKSSSSLEEGDGIKVKVLSVDKLNRKIFLKEA